MAKFSEATVDEQVVQPCEEREYNPEDPKYHWIEIELVYEFHGEGVPNEEYCIRLPSGAQVRGFLNAKGRARVNLIEDPGNCEISFPRLDQKAWEPA